MAQITERDAINIQLRRFGIGLLDITDEEGAIIAANINANMSHQEVADTIASLFNRRVQVLSADGGYSKRIKIEATDWDNMSESGLSQVLYEAS